MPSNKKYYEIESSNLETIDYAFYDFVNDKMNNFSTRNEGWKKVPILWASPERAFLSKNNKDLFDADAALKFPLISIERTSISKDLSKKGAYSGNPVYDYDALHGGRIVIGRRIVRDKTNNFAVADNIKKLPNKSATVNRNPGNQAYFPSKNEKVVYETITMPAPVYLAINYEVTVRTEYAQQMNQLTTPFATLGGHINSFLIKRDGHQYETFLQPNFAYNNNVANMGESERTFETTFTFEVLGYIMGESPNGDRPKIIKTQSAVEVKIPREHVIFGDIPEYGEGKGFYTE
jgi:hypothetical protein